MATVKEKYDVLKKKYNLPAYDELSRDFAIEDIGEESGLILQKVREGMHDKIEFYSKIIESILQPESSLSNLYEAHYLDDLEKNNAYSVFKSLMKILRYSSLVAVSNSEEENAKFIKESYKEWDSLQVDIQKHIKRLISLWEKETDIKEDLNYFG